MSAPFAPAPPRRVVAVLALLALGVWVVLTVAAGAVSAWHGYRWAHGSGWYVVIGDGEPIPDALSQPSVEVGVALFTLWLLSLNAVLVATILGVVDIALRQRSWRRCVAFAAVAVGGPAGALALSQARTLRFDAGYAESMLPGVAMIAVAVTATIAAARLLLRPSRQ